MIRKILCIVIASINLLSMAYTVFSLMHYMEEQPLLEVFISPCLANMVLAVLLVVGIATREISLIRLFKIFLYAQLVFALLMVVYGHRFFESAKQPIMVKAYFSIMFLVCALELIIVSSTIEALRKNLNPAEGLVVYMPVGHSA